VQIITASAGLSLAGLNVVERRYLHHYHLPFAIGDSERDQWMLCMNQAMDEVIEDEALRKELTAAFQKVADFMRNQ